MTLNRTSQKSDEDSLAARAAWLHFSGGLTQGQVAKRLGVPSTKAHRLIARATRDGLVRVFVDASVAECVDLEERLTTQWDLDYCRVAPDLGETGLPLRTLGLAGARFLGQALETRSDGCIGIGHGRTLAAVVNELPSLRNKGGSVVSLLGGLTRKFAANPFDVIHRLAEKTGIEAYMLPAPLYANSAEDRDVLLAQMAMRQVAEIARQADLLVAGIGGVDPSSILIGSESITPDEAEEVIGLGATGDILGHYLDAEGNPIASSLSRRVISRPIDELRGRNLTAIAGGPGKAKAILAVLKSGLLKGLITDEATALRLVNGSPDT